MELLRLELLELYGCVYCRRPAQQTIIDTVVCLIYVNDALLVYENKEAVEDLTRRMKQMGILFEEEDDVAGYLGVLIEHDKENGLITLTQGGLAKRILEALHLDNDSPSSAPT